MEASKSVLILVFTIGINTLFIFSDELEVPVDSSAAAQLQAKLPNSKVLKAFNTTFAGTLNSGKVGDTPTTVLIAGDDADAKKFLANALEVSPLQRTLKALSALVKWRRWAFYK